MKLADYLKREGLTLAEFGARVGVTHPTVLRWRDGQRPSWPSIDRIAAATDGAVTAADFMDPPAPAEPEAA